MNDSYRIKNVTFTGPHKIELSDVTVLMGPNNSGKSRALKEIVECCLSKSANNMIVSDLELTGPTSCQSLIDQTGINFKQVRNGWNATWINQTLSLLGSYSGSSSDHSEEVSEMLAGPNRQLFLRTFSSSAITYLTTDSRLSLLNNVKLEGMQSSPTSVLQLLFQLRTPAETAMSQTFQKHFKKQARLDFSDMQRIRIRISDDFSLLPNDVRDQGPFMLKQEELEAQGDGMRSFASVAIATEVVNRPITIIDEPEAFLHPPLANAAGRLIGQSSSANRQFIIATHSSELLRGILATTSNVTLIHMDRMQTVNVIRQVSPILLKEVIEDPLLNSARVLDGLFANAVLVTESDADSKFYLAALHRIAADPDNENKLDLHTVAVHNKQTVARVLNLYRNLGVNAVAIVDFDMLRNDEIEKALNQLGCNTMLIDDVVQRQREISNFIKPENPEETLDMLQEIYAEVGTTLEGRSKNAGVESIIKDVVKLSQKAIRQSKAWNAFKELGRSLLDPKHQSLFDEISDSLEEWGIFIHPMGELESSLRECGLPYTTNKKQWILSALPNVDGQVPDMRKEFWQFLDKVMTRLTSGVEENKQES